MLKVLFMIHDLGQGGAEKVLVNLVNNMDQSRFDISVIALFGGGVNEQFLKKHIHYKSIFKNTIPGNSKLMKVFTPVFLHKWFIKDNYDIEISYLEGPSARIISGSSKKQTKTVSWIHVEQYTIEKLAKSFRNKKEANYCYNCFDKIICVSNQVKKDFTSLVKFNKSVEVLYNTVESKKIKVLSRDNLDKEINHEKINLIAVGTLKESKGYERLLRVINKLNDEKYPICLYILGEGPFRKYMEKYIQENSLEEVVTLLGYQTNPYKYVAKCDLFVCASFAEGFSTAVTEALILGTPVCTVDVSGMRELLGDNNEYGIVTENSEEALYKGIIQFLDNPLVLQHYKKQAGKRGNIFYTENTVKAVEEMLLNL